MFDSEYRYALCPEARARGVFEIMRKPVQFHGVDFERDNLIKRIGTIITVNKK